VTSPYLIPDLKRDEGLRLSAYQDTRGIWTVGYGHAYVHSGTVWTLAQAENQLALDVQHTQLTLDNLLPWWRNLDDLRQDVLCEMGFNMGVTSLLQFHNTLSAVEAGDWKNAAKGMLDSAWAHQLPRRATRLSNQMLTGVHQE